MNAKKQLDLYKQHSRAWRENRYVYAVISRRSKGLSIGVNLNPDKACNFDCVYCCVDRTVPPTLKKVDLGILAAELDHMLGFAQNGEIFQVDPFSKTPAELRRINDVAFSGDGEPTAFAGFGEACKLTAELLAKHELSDTKIVVITNATLLHRPAVKEALAFLDEHNGEIWAKLDAGTEAYYRRMERTRVPMKRVLENLAETGRVRPIVIQSMFLKMQAEEPSEGEIEAYVDRLRELRNQGCQIKLVQVYTVARKTAEQTVGTLEEGQLEAIAEKVRGLGMRVEVYP